MKFSTCPLSVLIVVTYSHLITAQQTTHPQGILYVLTEAYRPHSCSVPLNIVDDDAGKVVPYTSILRRNVYKIVFTVMGN